MGKSKYIGLVLDGIWVVTRATYNYDTHTNTYTLDNKFNTMQVDIDIRQLHRVIHRIDTVSNIIARRLRTARKQGKLDNSRNTNEMFFKHRPKWKGIKNEN